MTDQEINAAIATALGWTDINLYEDNAGPAIWNGYPPVTIGIDRNGDWTAQKAKYHETLPNYAGSLDAMAAALATLTDEQFEGARNGFSWERKGYVQYLRLMVGADLRRQMCSTAREQATAFLRVHGAWKEGA